MRTVKWENQRRGVSCCLEEEKEESACPWPLEWAQTDILWAETRGRKQGEDIPWCAHKGRRGQSAEREDGRARKLYEDQNLKMLAWTLLCQTIRSLLRFKGSAASGWMCAPDKACQRECAEWTMWRSQDREPSVGVSHEPAKVTAGAWMQQPDWEEGAALRSLSSWRRTARGNS